MPPSRSFLLDKLNKWVVNNGSDTGEYSPRTLVLSAPNSSGKSHCLKEFCSKRNKSSSFSNNSEEALPVKLHHVVYYEFFGGGGVLYPEQTCEHVILYFLTETIKILDMFQNTPTTFDQANLEEEDAFTLFNEYLLFLLQSAKQQHDAEICFVLDGPERCVNAEKLWGLCSVLAEQAEARLLIATSLEPTKCVSLLQQRAGKVEYMTKMSFKLRQMDELVFTLFEEALLRRNGGDFDALDNDLVYALTEHCNGNVLMALLAIERGALDPSELCSNSEDAMFDEWFDAETWPVQLVARATENQDTLLARSAHARDWFYHTMSNKEVYFQAHAKLAENENALFHLTLACDFEAARQHVLVLDKLNAQVQQDFSRALLDVQAYCKSQPNDLQCRIVANVMLDSKPALLVDPRQLPFQLLGRLTVQQEDEDKELYALLQQCRKFRSRKFSWFAPQRASFPSPYEYTELLLHFTLGANNSGASPSVCLLGCDALMPNLIFIANSGMAKILDLDTRKSLANLVCPAPQSQQASSSCWLVAVDSTCCIAVVAMDKRAYVWYLNNPRITFHYDKQHTYTLGNDVECLEYSQHLPNLVVVGNSSDASAQLWQLPLHPSKTAFPKVIKTLRLPQDTEQSSVSSSCTSVAFVPQVAQNELVCTCFKLGNNTTICLWNLTNEQCIGRFAAPDTACLKFRSDGLKFATGGEDGILRIWSVEKVMANFGTEKRLDCDLFVPHTTRIQAVSFLDENDLVVTASAAAAAANNSSLVQVFNRNELVYSTVQPTTLHLLPGGTVDDEEESTRRLVCSFENRVLVLNMSKEHRNKPTSSTSQLAGPYPIAEKSVTCAVVNSKYLLLAQQNGEFCILELSTATLIKRLDLQSSASRVVLRQLWISTDGTRLRAQVEGGREMVWSIPSFEPYTATIASSSPKDLKDKPPASLKRKRTSWNLFAACTAAVPLPHHHSSSTAAPAEMWQNHLILPIHLQVRNQNFVENEQFATATFDSKLLSVWRVPPHVAGEVLVVVLECETGVVHLLHQNLMSVASPLLQRRISA